MKATKLLVRRWFFDFINRLVCYYSVAVHNNLHLQHDGVYRSCKLLLRDRERRREREGGEYRNSWRRGRYGGNGIGVDLILRRWLMLGVLFLRRRNRRRCRNLARHTSHVSENLKFFLSNDCVCFLRFFFVFSFLLFKSI